VGLTLQAKGDLAGALAAYREGRGIAGELAAKDRDDIRWHALNTAAILVLMIDLLKAQLTVLFCDMIGLTALAARLDLEDLWWPPHS